MYVYKIVNNINNKWYIGITKNAEYRWKIHRKMARIPSKESSSVILYKAMRKHGIENFTFTVLFSDLTEDEAKLKETLLIKEYETHYLLGNGYNMTLGGDLNSQIGSQNGKALLTEEEAISIITIREECKLSRGEVYPQFKHKLTERAFQKIWLGETWKHLQPSIISSKEKSSRLSTEDIITIISRRDSGTELQSTIYKDYQDKITFSGFLDIWSGRRWKHLQPLNITSKPNGKGYLTPEQVREIRTLKGTKSYKLLGEEYGVPASTISNIINNKSYKNIL